MELKEGYKQTEVGVIPEDWEPTLLDSVARRGSGHTPSKSFPEYWNGEVKWISLQDSHRLDNGILFDTEVTISEKGLANSSAKLHPAGTVVLSRDAGVGKSAIMGCDMAVSQHFMAWIAGNELDNFYLYYWLQITKPEFERIAIGNTIKTIGLPYFKALKVPLPPTKAEQEAIAEALSDADALIESLEQLITKKRQIKQGALQELLSGSKRLSGFRGEWEVKVLGEIVECSPSGTYGAERPTSSLTPMPVATTAQITSSDQWNDKPMQVRFFTSEQLVTYSVRLGDLVVVKSSGSAASIQSGKMVFVDRNLEGRFLFSNFLMRLRPIFVSPEFLYYFLTSSRIKALLPSLCEASTYPNIRINEYLEIEVPCPEKDEQTAIATILSDMDAEIAALETKLAKARQVKQGMMQELLTGNIRLI